MRPALLCILEAVEGGVRFVEVLDVIRCVLLCMLEFVDGKLYFLEISKAQG